MLTFACKQKSSVTTNDKVKVHNVKDSSAITDQTKTTITEPNKQNGAPMVELTPSFIPESGKKNMAVEFDAKKEHTVGIFRLPTLSSWQELISQMEYAPEVEIKNSFAFQPKAEWWVNRDIKTNIFKHNLLCYKKKDKNSIWFFSFNKNREVYFWK